MKKSHNKKHLRYMMMFVAALFLLFGMTSKGKVSAKEDKYPYMIKINKRMNTVTVYKKDSKGKYTVPYKAMVCSGGKDTPLGTFKTQARYRWKTLNGPVYGQYSTRITGSILFHSVYYYKTDPSTLSVRQYNKLGTTASQGCIRLSTVDAKWIYDNCKVGTTVTIYNSSNPGPLGKPKAIKLSGKYAWDPTDIWSKGNPYNKCAPKITGAKNMTVSYGAKVDLKKGIKAYNTTGYNVTSRLKTTGSVNSKKPGKYKITYYVKDEIGRTATKTVIYTVKEDTTKPVLKGVTSKVYRYADYKNKALKTYVLKGVSAYAGSTKLESKYITYTSKTVTNSGSYIKYQITYKATNPKNKRTTTATCYITLDKLSPAIVGVQGAKYLTETEFKALQNELTKKVYKGVTMSDNVTKASKLKVTTTLKLKSNYEYIVTYTVKDEAGNTTTRSMTIIVLKNAKLQVKEEVIEVEDLADVTDQFVRKNITFTARGKDYTSMYANKMKVSMVTNKEKTAIVVTYQLTVGDKKFSDTATYQLKPTEPLEPVVPEE